MNDSNALAQQAGSAGRCPLTGLPFFMEIDGKKTYGGPFDSYTTPEQDPDDDTWHSEHFCHDRGDWVEGGDPWDEEDLNLPQNKPAQPPRD